MSHLRALKEWYNNCDEPQVLFLEDDVSLETIKYWNFSWDELIVKFPKDFDCIQLLCIRENLNEIKFRKRYWDDWAATAYLIKREYVKRVLDQYYPNDEFLLTIPYGRIIPLVENIIFGLGNTYVIPLFIENINFISTFFERSIKEQHKANHLESSLFVFNWWQTNKNENQLKLLFD
jgi:GR25 family glycosyltransferase involved in LPS biosynthesis